MAPLLLIITPSGLTRNTRPFAASMPLIIDGPSPPVTRLSAIELASGWTKRVVSPAPMLKLFQLMIARDVDWLTVTLLVPTPVTAAPPPTTLGPSGLAMAATMPSGTRAVVASMTRRRMARLRMLVPCRRDEEEAPVIAGTLNSFIGRQIYVEVVLPPQPDPASG